VPSELRRRPTVNCKLVSKWPRLYLVTLVTLQLAGCVRHQSEPPRDDFVVVPGGWFFMGADEGRTSNRPGHRVFVDTFAIDRTEVTASAFAVFVAATGRSIQGWEEEPAEDEADYPAVGILWQDADAYCRWAGQRLPTEAEWEKAARGTDGRRYPWGETWDPARANTAASGPGMVVPVGSYADEASPYGALDMCGNASEWVADHFDPEYYSVSPDRNPQGPASVLDHGLRGGSWASPREHVQTFFRDSSHSVRPNLRVGFRCAGPVPTPRPRGHPESPTQGSTFPGQGHGPPDGQEGRGAVVLWETPALGVPPVFSCTNGTRSLELDPS
jgi:sulfatase modifying factor 1